MNAPELFPFRVFASLPERADRRATLLPRLESVRLSARWIEPVPVETIRHCNGFRSLRKRSCALTKRLALRLAQRAGAPSLLYFEDDVVFHPDFLQRIAAMDLPDDWGIFYFGCQHIEPPESVAPGLVRVRRALDGHAFAVRHKFYSAVRASMRGAGRAAEGSLHSDVLMSALHPRIPTYAAFPNLAWQAVEHSDLSGRRYSNYQPDGSQRPFRHVLAPFIEACELTCAH